MRKSHSNTPFQTWKLFKNSAEETSYPTQFFDREKTISILSQSQSETKTEDFQTQMLRPISDIFQGRKRMDMQRQSVSVPHNSGANTSNSGKSTPVQLKKFKNDINENAKNEATLTLKPNFDQSTALISSESVGKRSKKAILRISENSSYMEDCRSLHNLAFPTLTPFQPVKDQ